MSHGVTHRIARAAASAAVERAVASVGADPSTPSDAVEAMQNLPPGELFSKMWSDHALTMTLATIALPFGIFFAVFGRAHHQRLTIALVAVIGLWLGLTGIETLRTSLSDATMGQVKIPDEDYINYASAIVVALVLMKVTVNIFKLLGLCIGLACGWGLNALVVSVTDLDLDMYYTAGVYVIGAIIGYMYVSPFVMDKVGILYAVVGGLLIATSSSLFLWIAGVADYPDLWPIDITAGKDELAVNAFGFDATNYTNYYSIAIALVCVYIGLCTGGRNKKGVDETSPLLGDAEKGQAKK